MQNSDDSVILKVITTTTILVDRNELQEKSISE